MSRSSPRRFTAAKAYLSDTAWIEPLERRLTLSASVAAKFAAPVDPRADINLDAGWKFIKSNPKGAQAPGYADSAWQSVNLPHTWNATDGADGGNDYHQGTGWYRRHYTINAALAGKRFVLKVDGASINADVYVNGTMVASHRGAYSAFAADVTNVVKVGADNVIAVKVNNQDSPDVAPAYHNFTMFGGLHRDVHLIVTNNLQVSPLDYASPGVFLKTTNVSSASAGLEVRTDVRNANVSTRTATVKTIVTDAAGNIVANLSSNVAVAAGKTVQAVQNATVTTPHLWNGVNDPYLYTAYTQIYDGTALLDQVVQPVGFRFFRVDPNQGFSLNGKSYDLHGFSIHQDRAGKGTAVNDSDRKQDVALLKELGATAVRLVHGAHAEQMFDLMDQNGFVTWAEVPLVTAVPGTAAFTSNTQQQLIELIRQNYNHPSVIFWQIASEVEDTAAGRTLVGKLQTLSHQEDPTRPTSVSTNNADDAAVNFMGDTAGFDKYFGWYYNTANDLGPWLDKMHKAYPKVAMAISEYGAGANVAHHSLSTTKPDHAGQNPFHPEEYQSYIHDTAWPQIKARPYLWGKFIWELADSGADNRNEGSQPGMIDKGLVTYDRATKKDAFYYYKSNWTNSPVLWLTSKRWTTRTSNKTDVKVYSNLDSVTLTINGKKVGTTTPDSNRVVRWKALTLAPGANVVTVTGTRGGQTYTDTATWTLKAAAKPASFVPVSSGALMPPNTPADSRASYRSDTSDAFDEMDASGPATLL